MSLTRYILAPNSRWQGRDQTGEPCVGGKLYTYISGTTTPKATYQDPFGSQPNTNPIILDGKGEANVYWSTDDLYTIKLFTALDEEVMTQDNYPVVGLGSTPIVVDDSEVNIVRNEQFTFWDYGTSFSPVAGTGSQTPSDYIANDWTYDRVATTYTVNITRQSFDKDQTDVPNNPLYYLRYQATTTPTGETQNRLYQTYQSVRTFAGKSAVVSFYGKSESGASVVNVYAVQYFGTGGSPSASNPIQVGQFTLSTSWELHHGFIEIPELTSAQTVGTNGNDALLLQFNFPNDAVARIDLTNIDFYLGEELQDFPYEVFDNQFKELNSRINNGVFSTGDIKPTIKTVADTGWIMMEDQTIGNVGSGATYTGISVKALYVLLYANVTDAFAPVSGGRSGNSNTDFNAGKTITLTRVLGRVMGSAGTGSGLTARLMGEYLGTETHTLSIAEMPSHNHPGSTVPGINGGGAAGDTVRTDNVSDRNVPLTIAHQGDGDPHTIMQPTVFLRYMIKI